LPKPYRPCAGHPERRAQDRHGSVAAQSLETDLAKEAITMTDIATIQKLLFKFRDDRNWQQFHTLKNLIISLNLEAAELLELTQWKSDDEFAALRSDAAFSQDLKEECADVFLYLLLIANEGGFDLLQAAQDKIGKNAQRYPVDQAYGSSKKYTELKNKARGTD
jgi:NTP pyrophosphatase (non-canonical NTP hydrolase)